MSVWRCRAVSLLFPFGDFEKLCDDFEALPEQLLAIVGGKVSGEFLHCSIVNRGRVKPDAFEVGSANAGNGKIFILWHTVCFWLIMSAGTTADLRADNERAAFHRLADVAFGI